MSIIKEITIKKILYQMFVAYNCNGCSTALLTQHKNNPIYQQTMPKKDFGKNAREDRIYLDMRRSQGYTDELEKLTRDDNGIAVFIDLKAVATKKMRLRLTGYSQAEYWYAFSNKGYIMTYKNYDISKEDTI